VEVPAWSAALASVLAFFGGLFGDLLKRIIPTYTDLIGEVKDLRRERRVLDEEILGLEDALADDPETLRRKVRAERDEKSS